jgi:hypothetical protein
VKHHKKWKAEHRTLIKEVEWEVFKNETPEEAMEGL